MKKILIIAQRECESFFLSPVAYVIFAVFTLVASLVFFTILRQTLAASMSALFSHLPWIFIVICPAVTMRMIAEEKKMKTLTLLFTLPVGDWEIVLGKFLAGVAVFSSLLCFTLIYLATIVYFGGDPETLPLLGGYLGLLLSGGLMISIGLFASSLTSNQIVALVISVIAILVNFTLPSIGSPFGDPWPSIARFGSIWYHLEGFRKGYLDTRAFVYFGTTTFMFLFFTVRSLEARKWL